jgi:hypothetical protein
MKDIKSGISLNTKYPDAMLKISKTYSEGEFKIGGPFFMSDMRETMTKLREKPFNGFEKIS